MQGRVHEMNFGELLLRGLGREPKNARRKPRAASEAPRVGLEPVFANTNPDSHLQQTPISIAAQSGAVGDENASKSIDLDALAYALVRLTPEDRARLVELLRGRGLHLVRHGEPAGFRKPSDVE
jgi:hypothetical protein